MIEMGVRVRRIGRAYINKRGFAFVESREGQKHGIIWMTPVFTLLTSDPFCSFPVNFRLCKANGPNDMERKRKSCFIKPIIKYKCSKTPLLKSN